MEEGEAIAWLVFAGCKRIHHATEHENGKILN
jgi:hypothetical protein